MEYLPPKKRPGFRDLNCSTIDSSDNKDVTVKESDFTKQKNPIKLKLVNHDKKIKRQDINSKPLNNGSPIKKRKYTKRKGLHLNDDNLKPKRKYTKRKDQKINNDVIIIDDETPTRPQLKRENAIVAQLNMVCLKHHEPNCVNFDCRYSTRFEK